MPGAKGKSGGARRGAGRKPKEQSEELQSLLDKGWPEAARLKVIRKMASKAAAGDVKAATLLMAYGYGKPIETKQLTGEGGGPVVLRVKYDK